MQMSFDHLPLLSRKNIGGVIVNKSTKRYVVRSNKEKMNNVSTMNDKQSKTMIAIDCDAKMRCTEWSEGTYPS